MDDELKSLRIDRSAKRSRDQASPWATRWIVGGVLVFVLLGAGRFAYNRLNAATEVDITRVRAASTGGAGEEGRQVILNATGYIIAAHKIEVAAKVVGKVAWIGVDKGDRVAQGQVMVRLEDDEYRAQLLQAEGQLENLQAKLQELENGARPEEIAKARADMEQSQADVVNAKVTLDRTAELVRDGVLSRQSLDDARAKYDAYSARTLSLKHTYDLEKLGPRKEEIEAQRAAVKQAQGNLDFAKTQLENTVIRAPVAGTILERNVEKGEFVTTGFVGDKGAKGYVVSLANLNDLQVELDINQNDFAKLSPDQKGIVTTDAYPDRKYDGVIQEISPEANRQKATVQVKVQVLRPDSYLRPEMNASVAFYSEPKAGAGGAAAPVKPLLVIPSSAIRDGAVFVVVDGKAVKRPVQAGGTTSQGVQISSGLIGGEDLILNPPAGLKDGQKVKQKQS
ncbi:MAG TPA: efflux RND transporter periplasmic adaptor subunit [Bryobacteraceae bacterium]|jgi:HlyD family secretion protein|nr:efflux RND transporter periplasmic adaptor subunit [Bryobacteraceae bacterium]